MTSETLQIANKLERDIRELERDVLSNSTAKSVCFALSKIPSMRHNVEFIMSVYQLVDSRQKARLNELQNEFDKV